MSKENTPELSLEDKIKALDTEEEIAEESEVSEPVEEAQPSLEQAEPEEKPEEQEVEVQAEPEAEVKPEEAVEPEAYVPNLKYKVHDIEHEFDEKVAGFIKSKEDEDFFRDLYTKASGIDVIKPKLEKYREEAQTYSSKVNELEQSVKNHESNWDFYNGVIAKAQSGDNTAIDQLLDLIAINDQVLGRAVADRLERSPEEQARRKANAELLVRNHEMQTQNKSVEQKMAELERMQAEMAISQELASPDYADVAKFVDSKLGEGTFRKEVELLGYDLEVNKRQQVTVKQVADLVANKYRGFMPQAAPQPQASQPTTNVPKKRVVKNTQSIPNVGSGNADMSPGPVIKSLADLEKLASDYHKGKIDI